jgi:hypothetical protein
MIVLLAATAWFRSTNSETRVKKQNRNQVRFGQPIATEV